MNNFVFLFFSQYRIFWRLRRFVDGVLFWLRANTFGMLYRLREEKINRSVRLEIIKITWWNILWAILVAVILLLIDPYLYESYEQYNLKVSDDGDYVTFMATISGIGGVFIGLYYASISAVASSIYSKVPNNIRDLLTQERFGNVYIKFLSFVTFLGLVLIALKIIGLGRIYLAIPVMTLFSGVGIIAFVKLGGYAFNLFDPTKLSFYLFEQLQRWLETVKAGGFRWSDNKFQGNAHKQASLSLDTLCTLSDITSKQIHLRGRALLTLYSNLILFLRIYEGAKRSIPSDSQWYEQKYEHRDWYRTTDSSTSLANQTGTALQPKITNNKEWVEDRVIPILKDYLAINLKEERYREISDFASHFRNYIVLLAKSGRVDHALDVLKDFSEIALDIISPKSEKLVTNEVLEKLAIIEEFSFMPIEIALACREYVEKLDADMVEKRLAKINWKKDAELYRYEFPLYCLPTLEWLKPRLNFEIATAGHRISPIWYQKELLLQVESDVFTKNTNSLITKSSQLYKSWIEKTKHTKHPWLASAVMSREWEFWHKIDPQIEIWEAKWNNLSAEKKIKDLPWSNFDSEELKVASKNRQKELLELMSIQNIELSFIKRPEDFPDYAGQFLHTIGEVSFDALLTNDSDFFSSIFESYFYGCMKQFENLRPESSSIDWRTEQNLKIAIAPLLDLIAISGYARLMADYHHNESLWDVVITAWDEYFTVDVSKLSFFNAAISVVKSAFEISHRSILRTNWQMKIRNKLSDVSRHEVYLPDSISSDTVIDHGSALVRIFARGRYISSYDGIDIFTALYLCTKEGAEDLDFGWSGRRLQDSLDREESKRQSQDNSEVPE